MTVESEVRKMIRSVAASIKRAVAEPARPARQPARPQLESRNGYGTRSTGERSLEGSES